MAKYERRNSIALDDAYYYCRQLETKAERPTLFKISNALRTLDLALASEPEQALPLHISREAWSRIRDSLFNIAVSSFSGYFIVYAEGAATPLEAGCAWPENGMIEFYPQASHRKNDCFSASLGSIQPAVLMPLRWCFAEGRQTVSPADFPGESLPLLEEEEMEARALLKSLYEVCEEEAWQGKKKAHRKWWQLYWEASSCPDRRQKHQIEKQMVQLQSIWGRPSK